MTEMSLEGHLGRGVAIDICATCQAIWFDGYESLQLSAASVLKLFRLIGDNGGKVKAPLSTTAQEQTLRAVQMLGHEHTVVMALRR